MAVKVQGDTDPAHGQRLVRQEHDIQLLLQAHCNSILKARAWSSGNRDTAPQCLAYLYMDWVPHGSLWDLVESAESAVDPG
jgi:predicted metal-dependent hydrolase